jgi:hypothetical protein
MAKIDKSKYTKHEWQLVKEQRRQEKQSKKLHEQRTLARDSKIAFVLGNGTSRKSVPLEALRDYGTIYGCNALYRTFSPDYLVAVDVKMVLEINKAGYQHHNTVWTNPNKSYTKIHNLNYFKPSKGWSSGPTALWLASQHGYDQIYILGFDFRGLNNGKTLNNIFADTANYKKSTDGATFFGNWLRQTANVIKEHPQTDYKRIIAADNYCPEELNKFDNLDTIVVEDFMKIFNFS